MAVATRKSSARESGGGGDIVHTVHSQALGWLAVARRVSRTPRNCPQNPQNSLRAAFLRILRTIRRGLQNVVRPGGSL
ncbi:hypothetical protein Pla163_11080 [Planctomycetes bacterium Pla163]|uniref:Uncharacterized protein n=1 Tax=Rohdeia mirabilis TaxID=2528008 RepID=A0A518CXS3_9BACT|nr:hypothetical protein Pla163_11080 [Planctomycetes bacterium Pla163]